jgi:hypothetical protein
MRAGALMRVLTRVQMHQFREKELGKRFGCSITQRRAATTEHHRFDGDNWPVYRVRALIAIAVHLDVYATSGEGSLDAFVSGHASIK